VARLGRNAHGLAESHMGWLGLVQCSTHPVHATLKGGTQCTRFTTSIFS